MNERLKKYFDTLFEGAPDTKEFHDLREEIFLNTLDRYNDLIAQGKSEDASFTQAVAGIGDLEDVIGSFYGANGSTDNTSYYSEEEISENKSKCNTLLIIAVVLYFICVVPPILLYAVHSVMSLTLGSALMFLILSGAVALTVLGVKLRIDKEAFSDYINNVRLTKHKDYTKEEFEKKRRFDTILQAVGISLCVFSLTPFVCFSQYGASGIGFCLMFVILAVAVGILLYYNNTKLVTGAKKSVPSVFRRFIRKRKKINVIGSLRKYVNSLPLNKITKIAIAVFVVAFVVITIGLTAEWAIVILAVLIVIDIIMLVKQFRKLNTLIQERKESEKI